MDIFKKMMTISEIAELLSVTERTVYIWANNSEIPAYKIGNSWRFVEGEVEDWLKQKRNIRTKPDSLEDDPDEDGVDWAPRVSKCAKRIYDFLRSQSERHWVVENIAEALGEDPVLVRAAAKELVAYDRCEMKEQFINGKDRDVLSIKKGR